jgi:hypothetical protein
MANINNIPGIAGWQGEVSSCDEVSVHNLRNHIFKVFSVATSGSTFTTQEASSANGLFALIKNFECGNAYIFFRNSSSTATFNIPHFVQGNVENNPNRVTTLYPVEFSIDGHGEFHITSSWKEESPVYRTLNKSKYIWFDGSSYVLSSGVSNTANSLKNNSVLPNTPYGEANTSSATIMISNFTGNSSGANGLYVEVGYYKNQKLFRHALTGNYYYFFNGSNWVLTDTAINIAGSSCYINGSSELTGSLNNVNGSNGRCFDGQVGTVRSGEVDARSLGTESDADQKLLATESETDQKVLISEND